jgi:hypothetical protein
MLDLTDGSELAEDSWGEGYANSFSGFGDSLKVSPNRPWEETAALVFECRLSGVEIISGIMSGVPAEVSAESTPT